MTVIRLDGMKGIDAALNRLDSTVRADVLTRVAVESAQPMEQDYEAGAPHVLRGKVRTRVIRSSRKVVQVATGTKHPLAHIFEFGTKRRATTGGANRGRIVRIGFGRRAFDSNATKWFRDVGALLWREVKRARR